MAGLISAAEAVAIRAALGITLVHLYTRTAITSGAEDAHGDAADTPGPPAPAIPCRYEAQSRVSVTEGGVTTVVYRPTLTVAADDPLKPGDAVSDVLNAAGAVLLAGSFAVGRRLDDDPLGYALLRSYELLGADALGGVT